MFVEHLNKIISMAWGQVNTRPTREKKEDHDPAIPPRNFYWKKSKKFSSNLVYFFDEKT